MKQVTFLKPISETEKFTYKVVWDDWDEGHLQFGGLQWYLLYDAFVQKVATHIGSPVDRDKVLDIFSPDNIRKQYIKVYRESMGS